MILALALLIIHLLMLPAYADQSGQRIIPGVSLSLQGELLDLNAPVCSPAGGSYSVAYRNSIATGCATRASDDFATIVFTGSSAATYTMPQSITSSFTGSISGTTLSTPSNAVTIGSVVTGIGVLDNTYVTAGAGTSWTVNNSQTVGSETLTQTVFPPGHGSCFKNKGDAPLTITATTSTISGAAGVVNGTPAVPGGQVVLYPGGEACLQADPSNNYLVSGFLAGSWYRSAGSSAPVSLFQWLGLSGYPRIHLSCSGLASIGTPGGFRMQLAYGGTFQTSGYTSQNFYIFASGTTSQAGSTTDTSFSILPDMAININHEASLDMDLAFALGTGMGFSNDVHGMSRGFESQSTTEVATIVSGEAPLTTSLAVTGIKVFPAAGTFYGMCWLTPRT